MADLLWDIGLEWRMWLARHGDREPLAEVLRGSDPINSKLREFLAGVLDGSIKLKPPLPRTKTYKWLVLQRNLRESAVDQYVNFEMGEENKRRNKNFRTYLISKWCKLLNTTPALYREFKKRGGRLTHREARNRISAHVRGKRMGTKP